jgi:hypothetical protein
MLRLALLLCAVSQLRCYASPAAESGDFLFEQLRAYRRPAEVKLAVCAMFHNERRYLAEWVLYHWVLGFQHFYLYDNESDDSPGDVLASCEAFRVPLVGALLFLSELPLKEPKDKARFFTSLPGLLPRFPDAIAKYRLLPALLNAAAPAAKSAAATKVLCKIVIDVLLF